MVYNGPGGCDDLDVACEVSQIWSNVSGEKGLGITVLDDCHFVHYNAALPLG